MLYIKSVYKFKVYISLNYLNFICKKINIVVYIIYIKINKHIYKLCASRTKIPPLLRFALCASEMDPIAFVRLAPFKTKLQP